ncbi:MAG: recombinase family protein [Hyphomicrobiales bacterium]
MVRAVDASGEPIRGDRRINSEEGAIVVRIFRDFAAGLSPRKIAQRLNADSIPGPGGRIWRDTTIRGHATRRTGLLRNDLYAGKLVWNKQHYVKDPATGKRLARPNPPEQWIVHDLPELRIVEPELWDTVQERLGDIRDSETVRKARATKFWEKRRATSLLTGKVKCGHCGGGYAAVGRDYLACGTARQAGTCSNARSIRRPILENLILDALKNNLMQPELVEEFTAAFHDEINKQRRDGAAERGRIERALDRERQRLDGLIEAIADGLRTPGTLAKLEQLERRTAELEARLASKPVDAPILHPNLAQLYRRKVERLHDTLSTSDIGQEVLDTLRGLIDEVRLENTEDGFQIELIGDITKIVEFANTSNQNKKQPAFDERTACSVKVVAGVGFEPTTFRL